MNKLYFNRAFIYCILLIILNLLSSQIAEYKSIGFNPYPPVLGMIFIPIAYSLIYWGLMQKISNRKATLFVLIIPSVFYLLLILINSFAAWDLIYLLNELLNYPLCIMKYLAEKRKIASAEQTELFFYIILPILYQFIIVSIAKVLGKKLPKSTGKLDLRT